MTTKEPPIVIKKYANRRLYHTGTSTYVTLEDLAAMVKKGEDFVVCDAKSGEDITRPVLTQIIFEQEGKDGQSLLPIAFLRQLIRFYGDSMQMLVPSYLEFTIDKLTKEQQKFRDQFTSALGAGPLDRFASITLPLALPGILSGAVVGFSASLGEFGAIITFVSNIPGETQTLPLAIYSALQQPGAEASVWRTRSR